MGWWCRFVKERTTLSVGSQTRVSDTVMVLLPWLGAT